MSDLKIELDVFAEWMKELTDKVAIVLSEEYKKTSDGFWYIPGKGNLEQMNRGFILHFDEDGYELENGCEDFDGRENETYDVYCAYHTFIVEKEQE